MAAATATAAAVHHRNPARFPVISSLEFRVHSQFGKQRGGARPNWGIKAHQSSESRNLMFHFPQNCVQQVIHSAKILRDLLKILSLFACRHQQRLFISETERICAAYGNLRRASSQLFSRNVSINLLNFLLKK